jgi:hypothetical protein
LSNGEGSDRGSTSIQTAVAAVLRLNMMNSGWKIKITVWGGGVALTIQNIASNHSVSDIGQRHSASRCPVARIRGHIGSKINKTAEWAAAKRYRRSV